MPICGGISVCVCKIIPQVSNRDIEGTLYDTVKSFRDTLLSREENRRQLRYSELFKCEKCVKENNSRVNLSRLLIRNRCNSDCYRNTFKELFPAKCCVCCPW